MQLLGLLLILSSTSAFAGGYVDVGVGASHGRYESRQLTDYAQNGFRMSTITKEKSGRATGSSVAIHAGYRTHGFELGGAVRRSWYSIELPDIDITDDYTEGTREIMVDPSYTTSLVTSAIGPAIGYEYRGVFARGELGLGRFTLGSQPCLCFNAATGREVRTAAAEVGYRWYLSRDFAIAAVASRTSTRTHVQDQTDFFRYYDMRARMVASSVMVSVAYRPR